MKGWPLAATLLVTATIGALAGAWWERRASLARAVVPTVRHDTTAHTPADAHARVARAWAGPATDPAVIARDPVRLQALLDRYATEMEEDARGALLATLGALGAQDNAIVRRRALDLAAHPDPRMRRAGVDLLATFSLDQAEVRAAVVDGLEGEADPALLARFVELAVPTVLPADESAPLAASLQKLATHDDPQVRARSVVHAAQWASSGQEAEALLGRGLLDDAPEVRRAAVAGVIATRSRSERIKEALLWIAADANIDAEDRAAALFALQWHTLSSAEYAIYDAASAQLPAHD